VVPDGISAVLQAELVARASAASVARRASADADERLRLHEVAAQRAEAEGGGSKALKKELKALKREYARAGRLCLERFRQSKRLRGELSSYVYFETMAALEAHIAWLDACCPLESIIWLDTPKADDGSAKVPKQRKRKFPLGPKDAVVLWLFILRTGSSFKRAAGLFDTTKVSHVSARRQRRLVWTRRGAPSSR